ncbi:MFS transporter, partial [bacterium]|nr:MFS transporter [bacterium]
MTSKQEENSIIHKTLIITTISLSMLITNLDISIVNIALPTLAREYSTGTEEVSRIILLYVLAMAAFLPVFGKISDNKGTEKIFTLGYIVFTISSLLCALSPNLLFLQISRFIQGIGSAMLLANFAAITI